MEYRVGESQFFRDNYALETNGVHAVQAYFAKVTKGYALVFVFIGEDQKSVDEMAKAMETYALTTTGTERCHAESAPHHATKAQLKLWALLVTMDLARLSRAHEISDATHHGLVQRIANHPEKGGVSLSETASPSLC